MKSAMSLLGLLIVLSACASGEPRPDKFELMVMEWRGAHINDMAAVWGDANESVLPNPETGSKTGYVNWVIDRRGGNTLGGGRRSYCSVTAYFGPDGIIADIDVVSNDCGKFAGGGSRGVPDLSRPDSTTKR